MSCSINVRIENSQPNRMDYRQLGEKHAMKPLRNRTHRMPQSRDSGFKQEGGGAAVFGTPTFSMETKVLSFLSLKHGPKCTFWFSLEPCCSQYSLSPFKCNLSCITLAEALKHEEQGLVFQAFRK